MSRQNTKSKTKPPSLDDDILGEDVTDQADLKPGQVRKHSSVQFEGVKLKVIALQVDHKAEIVSKQKDFSDDLFKHFDKRRLKNLFNCMVQPKTIVDYETGQVIILYADYDFPDHFGKVEEITDFDKEAKKRKLEEKAKSNTTLV